MVLVLITAFSFAAWRTLPPPAIPASAPATGFSALRAVEHIRAIAQKPRTIGSPAFNQARDYAIDQLKASGFTTRVEVGVVGGDQVENILGRLEGSDPTGAVLLVAHLDSTPTSPGAMDDGSGVAAVLETVRALKAGPPLRNTLMVLISAPEERGGYGALAFASNSPWAKEVRVVIDLDAGGVSGPSILAATAPDGGWLVREFARSAPHPLGSSAFEALGNPKTDYTLALRKAGFIGYDFSLSWDKRIHSPYDNIDNVSPDSLQHQGSHMLAMTRRLGNLSLDFPRQPLPVYFDLLGLGVILYPVTWALPIMLVVAAFFIAVIVLGFKRKFLSLAGIGLGAVTLLVSLITAPVLIQLIWAALFGRLPPDFIPSAGNFDFLYWLRWASALLAVALTAGWYITSAKIKKVGLPDLAIGADALLFLGMVGTSLAFPLLSHVFTWPLLFSLLAIGVWFLTAAGTDRRLSLAGLLVAAVAAIVMLLPDILVAVMSLEADEVYLATVFIVVLFGFLVPQLHLIVRRK